MPSCVFAFSFPFPFPFPLLMGLGRGRGLATTDSVKLDGPVLVCNWLFTVVMKNFVKGVTFVLLGPGLEGSGAGRGSGERDEEVTAPTGAGAVNALKLGGCTGAVAAPSACFARFLMSLSCRSRHFKMNGKPNQH